MQRQRCVRLARTAPRDRHNPDGLAASETILHGWPPGPANLAIVTGRTLLPRQCIKAISRVDASFTKRVPEVTAAYR